MPQLGTLHTSAGDGPTFETSGDRVRTWQEARRSGSARWATHDVHLHQPVREFLGPGLDTLSMSIRLDAALGVVPSDELASVRSIRDAGQVVTLVIGGELIADFTIESIAEEWRRVDAAGRLAVVILQLELREHAS